MVDPNAKRIIENSFRDAMSLLKMSAETIQFQYEPIGGRFKTMENSMETNPTTVFVNENWANECILNYQFDLFFLPAHEARHQYQKLQIEKFCKGLQTNEDPELIQSWINNNKDYKRNEGPESFPAYITQPVEVDANAFANFYVMLRNIGQPRMSKESDILETQRLMEIAKQFGAVISGE